MHEFRQGDCCDELIKIPSASVDCVVTSPPYWGLRDYEIENQLGQETTFQEYLAKLEQIFNEVWRVLKDDGTCWVNLGDTYSTKPVGRFSGGGEQFAGRNLSGVISSGTIDKTKSGVKEKSLLQIPSRFAINMSDDGWILRNEIIWHKPSCMPTSAKDRFTVDFEKIFLFTKTKKYYFNQQFSESGANKRAVWDVNPQPFSGAHFALMPLKLAKLMIEAGCKPGGTVLDPFSGAGTTALACLELHRKSINMEINPEYVVIAKSRLTQDFQDSLLEGF